MNKFLSLSSGSSGNCYYIGNEHTSLVVDAGISMRSIRQRLSDNGLDINSIDMVLVTHDHIDHIKFLGTLASKLSVPVFATSKVHSALETHPCTSGQIGGCKRVIKPETFYENKGVKFVAFPVPHDASETVGYYIDFFGDKFVFMTDLGEMTDSAAEYSMQADYLIIESNFDTDMLISGSYAPDLKRRILQGHGHLSNEQCASALKRVYHPGLKSIYLCHLSENNNTPDVAYKSAAEALTSIGVSLGRDVKLYCLPRRESSPLFTIGGDI